MRALGSYIGSVRGYAAEPTVQCGVMYGRWIDLVRKGRSVYRRYLHSLSGKMAHFCQDTEATDGICLNMAEGLPLHADHGVLYTPVESVDAPLREKVTASHRLSASVSIPSERPSLVKTVCPWRGAQPSAPDRGLEALHQSIFSMLLRLTTFLSPLFSRTMSSPETHGRAPFALMAASRFLSNDPTS
ncbi:hypothetical protein VTN00DRAFT_4305 [Thermoascus crustaceus]|uniref:uncharacterized protein n=1 Tax=Thermoascus crustaceus TaxID=5088 RepID=UPI003742AEA8